ncbi:MAG: YbaK/EbsC family protein [Bacteroidales bacterium]|nr:YbaK/EbsC family protein [Bacteroidales bacterium]
MPSERIKEYLNSHRINYSVIPHSKAFTSQEIAASAHISGNEFAKTVMIKVDGQLAMAVLPASYKINFRILSDIVGSKNVELASEEEFRFRFPDCEVGAMPPFGNLWNMNVYVSERLAYNNDIVFNAGLHTELIRMAYSDFEQLVRPRVVNYSIA